VEVLSLVTVKAHVLPMRSKSRFSTKRNRDLTRRSSPYEGCQSWKGVILGVLLFSFPGFFNVVGLIRRA
jgi:hypothetical protein